MILETGFYLTHFLVTLLLLVLLLLLLFWALILEKFVVELVVGCAISLYNWLWIKIKMIRKSSIDWHQDLLLNGSYITIYFYSK